MTLSSNEVNDSAKTLLGDDSKESAAKAVSELNIVDPSESPEKKKRGRKPGSSNTVKQDTVLPLSPAELAFGASIAEGQALAIAGTLSLFSTPESTQKIYNLHVTVHAEKLSQAYAMMAREYGIEVSGKLACLAQLAMVQTRLARDCWNEWEPKEETEKKKEK